MLDVSAVAGHGAMLAAFFFNQVNLLQNLTQQMFLSISVAEPEIFICIAKCFARLIGSTHTFIFIDTVCYAYSLESHR